ncbi:conserved hypothetical protein [Candida dubliniensis CD36]|uniref:Uncharacterized protein n=1 Tax=Candida dubliniensis (strain CD36 / ATCC MYA-646 / CBS 7987 / NCPF 3949 / NRRL Y-17841) TaxID=573826 RepID=B9W9L0_CANDC|nr:conserved hypothetical protein [Candida dubliniensis CD36]CAX45494.1 conserved hypothetical protein [Candida dubliniensis CD36]
MQHTSAGGGFFSKIKENYSSKLAGLSLAGGPYVEKDGSSEDSTLIHNAFVKYYDSKGLPYPDWLGVKTFQSQQQQQQQQGYGRNQYQQDYSQSKYQPVRQDNTFNNSYATRQQQQQQQYQQQTNGTNRPNSGGYHRSSSRLQDLYNKSRQQTIPGQGYNTSNSWSNNR